LSGTPAAGERAAEHQLRPVTEVLEGLPPLSPRWMALLDFAAGYYQRQVGELALGVLPPELRKVDDRQLGRRLTRLLREPPQATPSATAEVAGAQRRTGRRAGRAA
jgi:primosomal protein N' (replication factor Y)